MIKNFATYLALNVDCFKKRSILTIFANSKAFFQVNVYSKAVFRFLR